MGYIKRADLPTVFDRIRQDAITSTGCTVLLLAAVNVDALCALKIIMVPPFAGSGLLLTAHCLCRVCCRASTFSSRWSRCAGTTTLPAFVVALIRPPRYDYSYDVVGNMTLQLRSVVLIGCGAVADLASYLRSLPTRCSVYIIDGSRPYSLDNLFNNSQVHVVDDGEVEGEEGVWRDAFEGSLLAVPFRV
jgi:hypothetical protein